MGGRNRDWINILFNTAKTMPAANILNLVEH